MRRGPTSRQRSVGGVHAPIGGRRSRGGGGESPRPPGEPRGAGRAQRLARSDEGPREGRLGGGRLLLARASSEEISQRGYARSRRWGGREREDHTHPSWPGPAPLPWAADGSKPEEVLEQAALASQGVAAISSAPGRAARSIAAAARPLAIGRGFTNRLAGVLERQVLAGLLLELQDGPIGVGKAGSNGRSASATTAAATGGHPSAAQFLRSRWKGGCPPGQAD